MPGKRVVEQPIMLCVISACYRRLDAHQIPRARTRETGCCVGVGVGGGDAAVHGGGKAFRPFRRSEDACSEMSGARASGVLGCALARRAPTRENSRARCDRRAYAVQSRFSPARPRKLITLLTHTHNNVDGGGGGGHSSKVRTTTLPSSPSQPSQ